MKLEPLFWHRYRGKSILVFDDLFSKTLVESLGVMFSKMNYQRRPSFDNELSIPMDNSFFKKIPVMPEVLKKIVEKFYSEASEKQCHQKLSHIYCASMRYGDHTIIHNDTPCADCMTFLYYGNLHWDSGWGGETTFFDDNRNAMFAVTPKPGRLVLFNATLYHRAGIPMRDCPNVRYGMSIFYRCKKNRAIMKKLAEGKPV